MTEDTLNSMENDSPTSAAKKNFKKVAWTVLFVFLLVFFTFTKLPQAKMTNLLQGYIQVALDPYGIYITDQGRELSIWRGFEYKLIHPTLELSDQTRVELDEIVATPSILSLFKGQMGAHLSLKQGPALITLDGSGRSDKIDATVKLEELDIGKFGLLSYAGGLKGSGQINGKAHVDGALSDFSSLDGGLQFKLKKIHLDDQSLMGIQLPPINIAEGNIDINIEHGKLVMKNVQIGKPTDDIQITLTGDITLNKNLNSSTLNLRAVLGFSEKLKQSLTLLDSIMGSARQLDGKYAYKISGNFASPFPIPDSAQK